MLLIRPGPIRQLNVPHKPHAILQGHDAGVQPEEGADGVRRIEHLPGLHAEENDLHDTHVRRVIRGVRGRITPRHQARQLHALVSCRRRSYRGPGESVFVCEHHGPHAGNALLRSLSGGVRPDLG